MSLPPDGPGQPGENVPPPEFVPSQFFPGEDKSGHHHGIDKEIKKQRYNHPQVTSEADYRMAYIDGFRRARDYLFRLPSDYPALSDKHIARVHQYLYLTLYRDAGLWTTQIAAIGGGAGADPSKIEAELALLREQSAQLVARWRHPPDTGEGVVERLIFIAFYHARFLRIHPFRDGNGRVARMIAQWQEWFLLQPAPRTPVPRDYYMEALPPMTHDLAPLVNVFGCRHPGPVHYFDEPLAPPFPVHVTIR